MKKIVISLFGLLIIFFLSVSIFLSTKGFETTRFNNLISEKVKSADSNLALNVKSIKIKLDFKEFKIFLSTTNPQTKYGNINVPVSQLKIYFDFFTIFKKEPNIEGVNIVFDDLNISEIKQLILRMKPSNIKSFILNNISGGKLKGSIRLGFLNNFEIADYQIKGSLKKTNINLYNKVNIKNTSFNFAVDNNIILINSLTLNLYGIPVTNGTINIKKDKGYVVEGNLNTKLESDISKLTELVKLFPNIDFLSNDIYLKGDFLNKFKINFNENLRLDDYIYNLTGNSGDIKITLNKEIESSLLKNSLKEIFFSINKAEINFAKNKKTNINLDGNYKTREDGKFQKLKIKNIIDKSKVKYNIVIDLNDPFFVEILNYNKKQDIIANISTEFSTNKKGTTIKYLNYNEGKSSIKINNLDLNKKKQIKKFSNIKINTFKDKVENNNFNIVYKDKITIKGKIYDSSNLIKNVSNQNKGSLFNQIDKEIRINFENILTKLSMPLNNFNLIGKIEKGKFTKISSKSDFSKDEYLDISLKKDPNSNKKILEIYSGLAKPLLADFNFFKGIEGGQLLFSSTFDNKTSVSNLKIKDFKVLNAPAFAKLLALADLSGLVVLLSGEGLTFDSLEIKFTDDEKVRNIKEVYAEGPSITILMEGYIENKSGLTSLRGTMVPAKEINKLISKIPVLGDILIGKEVGEGVFGVSFKMKGPPGKIKTTVNPIKTLTPRFITRALEKRKKENKNN